MAFRKPYFPYQHKRRRRRRQLRELHKAIEYIRHRSKIVRKAYCQSEHQWEMRKQGLISSRVLTTYKPPRRHPFWRKGGNWRHSNPYHHEWTELFHILKQFLELIRPKHTKPFWKRKWKELDRKRRARMLRIRPKIIRPRRRKRRSTGPRLVDPSLIPKLLSLHDFRSSPQRSLSSPCQFSDDSEETCFPESEEVYLPDSEEASFPESEEVDLPDSEEASFPYTEEVHLPDMVEASFPESEEVRLPDSEEASFSDSEDASFLDSDEESFSASEEARFLPRAWFQVRGPSVNDDEENVSVSDQNINSRYRCCHYRDYCSSNCIDYVLAHLQPLLKKKGFSRNSDFAKARDIVRPKVSTQPAVDPDETDNQNIDSGEESLTASESLGKKDENCKDVFLDFIFKKKPVYKSAPETPENEESDIIVDTRKHSRINDADLMKEKHWNTSSTALTAWKQSSYGDRRLGERKGYSNRTNEVKAVEEEGGDGDFDQLCVTPCLPSGTTRFNNLHHREERTHTSPAEFFRKPTAGPSESPLRNFRSHVVFGEKSDSHEFFQQYLAEFRQTGTNQAQYKWKDANQNVRRDRREYRYQTGTALQPRARPFHEVSNPDYMISHADSLGKLDEVNSYGKRSTCSAHSFQTCLNAADPGDDIGEWADTEHVTRAIAVHEGGSHTHGHDDSDDEDSQVTFCPDQYHTNADSRGKDSDEEVTEVDASSDGNVTDDEGTDLSNSDTVILVKGANKPLAAQTSDHQVDLPCRHHLASGQSCELSDPHQRNECRTVMLQNTKLFVQHMCKNIRLLATEYLRSKDSESNHQIARNSRQQNRRCDSNQKYKTVNRSQRGNENSRKHVVPNQKMTKVYTMQRLDSSEFTRDNGACTKNSENKQNSSQQQRPKQALPLETKHMDTSSTPTKTGAKYRSQKNENRQTKPEIKPITNGHVNNINHNRATMTRQKLPPSHSTKVKTSKSTVKKEVNHRSKKTIHVNPQVLEAETDKQKTASALTPPSSGHVVSSKSKNTRNFTTPASFVGSDDNVGKPDVHDDRGEGSPQKVYTLQCDKTHCPKPSTSYTSCTQSSVIIKFPRKSASYTGTHATNTDVPFQLSAVTPNSKHKGAPDSASVSFKSSLLVQSLHNVFRSSGDLGQHVSKNAICKNSSRLSKFKSSKTAGRGPRISHPCNGHCSGSSTVLVDSQCSGPTLLALQSSHNKTKTQPTHRRRREKRNHTENDPDQQEKRLPVAVSTSLRALRTAGNMTPKSISQDCTHTRSETLRLGRCTTRKAAAKSVSETRPKRSPTNHTFKPGLSVPAQTVRNMNRTESGLNSCPGRFTGEPSDVCTTAISKEPSTTMPARDVTRTSCRILLTAICLSLKELFEDQVLASRACTASDLQTAARHVAADTSLMASLLRLVTDCLAVPVSNRSD